MQPHDLEYPIVVSCSAIGSEAQINFSSLTLGEMLICAFLADMKSTRLVWCGRMVQCCIPYPHLVHDGQSAISHAASSDWKTT